MTTREMIKKHEGLKLKPYVCPAGHATIGYGHNMDASRLPGDIQEHLDIHGSITRDMAERLLTDDIAKAEIGCGKLWPGWSTFSPGRQAGLVDFLFNVGLGTASTFVRLRRAVNEGRWKDAAAHLLTSRYAAQVKGRAIEVARLLEEG